MSQQVPHHHTCNYLRIPLLIIWAAIQVFHVVVRNCLKEMQNNLGTRLLQKKLGLVSQIRDHSKYDSHKLGFA